MTLANTPPQDETEYRHDNVEIEAAVIGLLLIDAKSVAEIFATCAPKDFAHTPHGRIVEVCKGLHDDGMNVTPLTVRAKLGNALDEIGGLDYLTSLAKAAPLSESAKHLAGTVSDLAMRRRADEELETGREHLKRHDIPLVECLSGVIETTNEAIDRSLRRHGQVGLSEAVDAELQKLETAMNGHVPPAIRIGLTRLDCLTGGFHPGDLVVVAGRPGMGKSILLSSVCRAAAQDQAPALFISLEMPSSQLIARLITDLSYSEANTETPLAYTRFRSGRLDDAQFTQAYDASQKLKELEPYFEVFDGDSMCVQEIAALAERFASRSKQLGVIAIDYLQNVKAGDRYKGSKVQEITEISNALKALAKRIGWPVVVGCQLNREVERREVKRPTLADLRESGAIEQDADIVCGLYRPGYYINQKRPEHGEYDEGWAVWKTQWDAEKNDLEINVLKNRNGPTGIARAHIEVASSAIRNRQDDVPAVPYPEGYAR